MPHPIENIMQTSMEQLKNIVDVNTVVGHPVQADQKTVVLPVSKVSLGFLSGGGEYFMQGESSPVKRSGDMLDKGNTTYPFAGLSAAGMSLTPLGFLYIHDDVVRVLPAQSVSPLERMTDAIPQALKMLERLMEKAHARTAENEQG